MKARYVITVIALGLLGSHTSSRAQADTMVFGYGHISCATWAANAGNESDITSWVLGYWTGLNRNNRDRHQVGRSTDAEGVLAEARRTCASRPSERLFEAVAITYVQMMQREH